MSQMRLTRTAVQALTPPVAGESVVMDSELSGFGVRVMPSGVRTYFIRYRVGGGRRAPMRRLSIGRHGHLTPEQAREAARRALAAVALGGDPAADRSRAREAKTTAELIDEWLAGPGKRNRHGKLRSASSYLCDVGRLNRHVKPVLGRVKLPNLSRVSIEQLRDAIARGTTATVEKTKPRGVARVTGGEGAATRTLRTFSVVLNYAVQRGYIDANPSVAVRKTPDAKCQRFLSPEELARLGGVLRKCEAGADAKAAAVVRLLALTGCRRREIESLQWTEVDLGRGFLRLADSKTGAKVVYLPVPAAEIISQQPRLSGSSWVFPASIGTSHYQGTPKVWARIRLAASLPDVRLHDLRHTYASQGLAVGASLEVVAELLGHKERRTTERYAHLAKEPVRRAANDVADQIAAMLG